MPRSTLIAALVGLIGFAVSTAPAGAVSRHPSKPAKLRDPTVNDLGRPPRPIPPGPLWFADAALEPLAWSDLDGWAQDDHAEAFATFRASCRAVLGQARSGNDARPILPALADVCRKALAGPPIYQCARLLRGQLSARAHLSAGRQRGLSDRLLRADRRRLALSDPGIHRAHLPAAAAISSRRRGYRNGQGFPNSGRSMRERPDGTFVPYYDRGEIEDGALDGQRLEICWIKDPIDLLFIQIQGSARVRLEDGTMLRINYDAHNGYPYTAVGRILIERKEVPREEMSMERIRDWMNAHPDRRQGTAQSKSSPMCSSASSGSPMNGRPTGAQGVPLTPRRSIAVDKALHVYGTPFYIEAGLPVNVERRNGAFHRLMIAQDTGSAIVGPARADIYFGAGDDAGKVAGRLRHAGMFALLMPRALDPTVAGAAMPLPTPRPVASVKTSGTKGTAHSTVVKPRPARQGRVWWRRL